MAVLFAYPFLLRYFFPSHKPVLTEQKEETLDARQADEKTPAAVEKESITPAGPMIQPAEQPAIVRFENDLYEAEFSTLGGTITHLVYKGDPEHKKVTNTVFYSGDPNRDGILGIRFANEKADLTKTIFKLTRKGKEQNIFSFQYEKPGEYRIVKDIVLSNSQPVISLDVSIQNLAPQEQSFTMELTAGLNDETTDPKHLHEFQAVAKTDKVVSSDYGRIVKKGYYVTQPIVWGGLIKKYFAFIIKPEGKFISLDVKAEHNLLSGRFRLDPFSVREGATVVKPFFVFVGPQRYETLKSFSAGFEEILSRGFLGEFKILLLRSLKFSHRYTHNFGWDIILLTLIIKLLFSPLTHMSYKSMERMKAIQPKMKAIQERYKSDPAKMNKEVMELYKKHKVNPMGGCLPMLLQIPIFIAFYQVLNETIELRGAPFIGWITDLSEPDRLAVFGFSLPLIGNSFNLLPLLMIASMVLQQRLTPQTGTTPEQQKIFNFMPLIFGFIFYKMPSGLVLYWFLNNMLSIFQQVFVKRIGAAVLHHEHE